MTSLHTLELDRNIIERVEHNSITIHADSHGKASVNLNFNKINYIAPNAFLSEFVFSLDFKV